MTFVWVQKVPMEQYATVALLYPQCAISQTIQSQGSISKEFQYNAKKDLIRYSKKKNLDSCNVNVFSDKGMTKPQIQFGFFLAF